MSDSVSDLRSNQRQWRATQLIWNLVIPLVMVSGSIAAEPGAPKPLTMVTTNSKGQNMLADTFGKTLYVFDVDQGKPTSACNGGCAEIWPPYLLSADEVARVVAPFGVVQRTSQQPQLTYNGRPIYTYIFDREINNDLGDGVGKVWHLIAQ
jgi:predicted lipoprotein with Yx(FWY)xxD motif